MTDKFQLHRGYTGKNFSREAMARQMRGTTTLVLWILALTVVAMLGAVVFVFSRDGTEGATQLGFIATMVGVAILTAVMFGFILLRLRRRKALYREGQMLRGYVTSASARDRNGYYVISLTYEFSNRSGAPIKGKAQGMWNQSLPLPSEGTPVDVLYQSDRLHVPI